MITDFLKLKISKKDLAKALDILKKFKDCESVGEWLSCSFQSWIKLEQLEEFLEYLVNKKPLKEDTVKI